jgi:hypothetical protein
MLADHPLQGRTRGVGSRWSVDDARATGCAYAQHRQTVTLVLGMDLSATTSLAMVAGLGLELADVRVVVGTRTW